MRQTILISIFSLMIVQYGFAQNFGDSDLIDSIARSWQETSFNHERIITFKNDGTFETVNIYNDFKITGQYWLYETPVTALKAYNELVENGTIKSILLHKNPFIIDEKAKDSHPDVYTTRTATNNEIVKIKYHGFILKEVFSNGYEYWSGGVWYVYNKQIFMKGRWSKASTVNNFYFKGRDDSW